MHDFNHKNKESDKLMRSSEVTATLKTIWPDMLDIIYTDYQHYPKLNERQLDFLLVRENGVMVKFEFKCITSSHDFGNILIEVIANEEENKPGWVFKPCLADYYCYYKVANKTTYLLDAKKLQDHAKQNKEALLQRNHLNRKTTTTSLMHGEYTTVCIAYLPIELAEEGILISTITHID